MSFEKLTSFAKRVAGELQAAGVAPARCDVGLDGWLVNELLIEESTLTGPGNTELKITDEQVWLITDGRLVLRTIVKYTVFGRGTPNNTEHSTVVPLNAEFARKRDGRDKWSTWVDRRDGGWKAFMGQRQFYPPTAGRPEFLALSSAISRIRPPGARPPRPQAP
jgi:hypothetical protein